MHLVSFRGGGHIFGYRIFVTPKALKILIELCDDYSDGYSDVGLLDTQRMGIMTSLPTTQKLNNEV